MNFIKRRLTQSFILLSITFATFVVIEGMAATLLFVKRFISNPVYENVMFKAKPGSDFMMYDALLGWVNRPNAQVNDSFPHIAPNKIVINNALGFRNRENYQLNIPTGKHRILCSGDSMTFGEGVSNDETWCHYLSEILPGTETVNLGMAGYGVDQAFLRYQRDGLKLQHDIHIFAFFYDDFDRMRRNYAFTANSPKPMFKLNGNLLELTNVPVPFLWSSENWLMKRSSEVKELKSVGLLSSLFIPKKKTEELTSEDTYRIAMLLFEKLRDISNSNGTRLVLFDLHSPLDTLYPERNVFRDRLKADTTARGLAIIDILDELRDLPTKELGLMFYGTKNFHYNAYGNKKVAQLVYSKLKPLLSKFPKITPPGKVTK